MKHGWYTNEDCDLCGKESPEVTLRRLWIGYRAPSILCARCGMLVYDTIASLSLSENQHLSVVFTFP